MSCTIEKALADAKALVERLREHDNAAEALIEQTTALNKRVEAMKQVCSLIFPCIYLGIDSVNIKKMCILFFNRKVYKLNLINREMVQYSKRVHRRNSSVWSLKKVAVLH